MNKYNNKNKLLDINKRIVVTTGDRESGVGGEEWEKEVKYIW